MTIQVNTHEAKTQLSKLLVRVQAGEEIVIAKAGKPIARLVAIHEPAGRRVAGSARHRMTIGGEFDAPLPDEVLSEFER